MTVLDENIVRIMPYTDRSEYKETLQHLKVIFFMVPEKIIVSIVVASSGQFEPAYNGLISYIAPRQFKKLALPIALSDSNQSKK